MKTLMELFFTFFQIGLFSIGGGYAIIPMIYEKVVAWNHWLTAQEFTDIITISQMTPGPLAVNTSTFVGMRLAGPLGALSATIGCILMGVAMACYLYHIFQKHAASRYFVQMLSGLKASSLGLIASAGALLVLSAFFGAGPVSLRQLDWANLLLFALLLFWARKRKPNPVWVMLCAGAAGAFLFS